MSADALEQAKLYLDNSFGDFDSTKVIARAQAAALIAIAERMDTLIEQQRISFEYMLKRDLELITGLMVAQ